MCAIQHRDAPSIERIIVHEPRSMLSAFWTMTVLAIACAALGLLASWRRRSRPENLGSVSDRWIAEHRSGTRTGFEALKFQSGAFVESLER